ncbi:MAG: hypothetical protein IT223_04995 [Crocinitomicaceae bacterium]|nr:hypothetical protein [Crocinitomicaceae bacterium]
MKKIYLFSFTLSVCFTVSAQVQIDQPVQMTGLDGSRAINYLELCNQQLRM